MRIIVDDKIPYIREALDAMADDVIYVPGRDITPAMVREADALIVRTRTRCDRSLLEGSRVRFLATATIGTDHIDTAYCHASGIRWVNAPGCNAPSVAQYVEAALLLLHKERGCRLEGASLGIVGEGHVGTLVHQVALGLGMQVKVCDPPKAQYDTRHPYYTLEELARTCDVLTFHVPLLRDGAHPTFHMADEAFFASLQRRPVLLNTSRGEVVETEALKRALHGGTLREAVIDVWENEPDIDRELLQHVFLGTPHIAGYSADGKANATRQVLQALNDFFGLHASFHIEPPQPSTPVIHATSREDALLQIYNPHRDSRALKQHPECFEKLRGDYPLRREEKAYTLQIHPA